MFMTISIPWERPARACAALACAWVGLAANPALARDGPQLAVNAGAASDYVFRGVSQTGEDPQLFAGLDVTEGRVYAGAWASNVDFGDSTKAEIDLYAGVRPALGPVTLDLGAVYYGYVEAPDGADYGNWEAKAAAAVPFGRATLGGAIFYAPDGFGTAAESLYAEVNAAAPLSGKLSVSGALGRQAYDGAGDYTTWNVGAAYALTSRLALDLRYHDTSEHVLGAAYGRRAVATLKASF